MARTHLVSGHYKRTLCNCPISEVDYQQPPARTRTAFVCGRATAEPMGQVGRSRADSSALKYIGSTLFWKVAARVLRGHLPAECTRAVVYSRMGR